MSEDLKGRRVTITFDKELLELEERYQKLPDAQGRSELVRKLYNTFLNGILEKEEK